MKLSIPYDISMGNICPTQRAPGEDHPGTSHPNPGKVRRGRGGGSLRVFKHFTWLEVASVKAALSRPTPPDRACRDHQRVTHTVGPLEGFFYQ